MTIIRKSKPRVMRIREKEVVKQQKMGCNARRFLIVLFTISNEAMTRYSRWANMQDLG